MVRSAWEALLAVAPASAYQTPDWVAPWLEALGGHATPLFVVGPEGDTSELVNYRVRGNYMIVDRLFAAAELRFGAGKNQKRVRIVRTDGRPAS